MVLGSSGDWPATARMPSVPKSWRVAVAVINSILERSLLPKSGQARAPSRFGEWNTRQGGCSQHTLVIPGMARFLFAKQKADVEGVPLPSPPAGFAELAPGLRRTGIVPRAVARSQAVVEVDSTRLVKVPSATRVTSASPGWSSAADRTIPPS